MNYARYSTWLKKHILWLLKSKLLTLNISWFTAYSLPQICVILSDLLYFLNSWNNKLLRLPAWKLSNNIPKQWVFHKFISIEAVVNEETLGKGNVNGNPNTNFTSLNLPFEKRLTTINLFLTHCHKKQKIIKK